MDPRSEKDLIARCRNADRKAFSELVERYKTLVVTLVDRMVPDKAIIEDLAQEVFLRVYQGLRGFRGDSRLSTWIYRIAYNVCAAELERSRYRVDFISIDETREEEGPPLELRDETQDPEALLEGIDFRWTLPRLLDRLPPRYKAILTLCYLEDQSYEEIGKAMDLPGGTVKTHLHRAKRELRNLIVREGLWKEMASGYRAQQGNE